MSRKITRDTTRYSPYILPEYSKVEKGTQEYKLKSFSFEEEVAIQENFDAEIDIEPETILPVGDIVTDDLYLPPSKLVKAKNGAVGDKISLFEGNVDSSGFVESPHFADANQAETNYPKKVISQNSNDFSESGAGVNQDGEPLSSVEKSKISELESIINIKNLELEQLKEDMAIQMQKAVEEAKIDTRKIVEEEITAIYSADKNDYLEKIDKFNQDSLAEIKKIEDIINGVDDQMADIVVGFVRSIIGEERKINDEFIIKLIQDNMKNLIELKDISFAVNPEDLDIVKSKFPDYIVSTDTEIDKGSVRVHTRVGDIELNSDKMIEDLKRQINEEFRSIKNS